MNKKNKRGSTYWVDGKPYISVTEILKVIDKPALRYWFGHEVYLAMVNNPSLSKEEALAAPYKVSDSAKHRGQTVHSIVEAYKHTKEHIESIPEQYNGYAQAFYSFVEHMKPIIHENERTVISKEHHYAGTLDMIASFDNKRIVIDIKTGKDIYNEALLQVSAYHHAVNEEALGNIQKMVTSAGVLLLKDDGSYKLEIDNNPKEKFKGFLAAKTLYESLNSEILKKIGYLL